MYPARLYFEECHFQVGGSHYTFNFPLSEALWFRNNKFHFKLTAQAQGEVRILEFNFTELSKVWFVGNDFTGTAVLLRCVSPTSKSVNPYAKLSCIANRGISLLSIIHGFSFIEIMGMNHIDWLQLDGAITGKSVYLGPREKIEPNFNYCFKHRTLFLRMRENAALQQDTGQLAILNRQLDRIEYYLNKQENTPILWDFGGWSEYWQDRLIYAWKRGSSDFYKSWLRPLFFLLFGYLLINALPAVWLENFPHPLDLILRSITDLPRYEASVATLMGSEYQSLSEAHRRLVKALGFYRSMSRGMEFCSVESFKAVRVL